LAGPDKPLPVPRDAVPDSADERDARHEVEVAERRLQEALGLYTEKHPDVVEARKRVDEAKQRLKRVEAGQPAELELPAGPIDRAALQRQLEQVKGELSQLRAKGGDTQAPTKLADDVVSREGEYAALNRSVEEGRERVQTLETRV